MPHLTKARVGGKENEADQRDHKHHLPGPHNPVRHCLKAPQNYLILQHWPDKVMAQTTESAQSKGTLKDHRVQMSQGAKQAKEPPSAPLSSPSMGISSDAPEQTLPRLSRLGAGITPLRPTWWRPPLGGISQMSLNFATCRPALGGGNHPQTCFDR